MSHSWVVKSGYIWTVRDICVTLLKNTATKCTRILYKAPLLCSSLSCQATNTDIGCLGRLSIGYLPCVWGLHTALQEISQGRSPRLISLGLHNPHMRSRYLSYTTVLSVVSQYTTVFSCCGKPLSCNVIPLLPRCHSSRRLSCKSPIAHSSRRLWAHIPRSTLKDCHSDVHTLWYKLWTCASWKRKIRMANIWYRFGKALA